MAELAAFIDHLQRGGKAGYYWTVDQADRKRAHWWNGSGRPQPPSIRANLYFGVNPCGAIPHANAHGEAREPQYIRSRTDLIVTVNCLFAEFDAKQHGDDLDATLTIVEALTPHPSVVVASGGGYHCYWLLDAPWMLSSEAERAHARQVLATWVDYTGGDPASKDLARMLRVPGSWNFKYTPPRRVSFVCCDLDRLYTRDELIRIIEPTWARQTLDRAVERVRTAGDGEKHHTLLRMARLGGGVAHVLGHETIATELYDAIEERAANPTQAARTIADGIQHGAATPLHLAPVQAAPRSPPARTTPSERILAALNELGYHFRLNLLDDTIEVNGNPISDIVRAQIRTELRDREVRPLSAVEDVYTTEAARCAYHPIRAYLDSLVWDGQNHIGLLCECLHGSDSIVAYSSGDASLTAVYLYRWLIGAVAKVYTQAQNLMLVLAGPQGIGKSAFVRWLCPLPAAYIEAPLQIGERDTDLRLMTRWIWEVSELDATTRKADVAALKDFITRSVVTVRKPYGRHDVHKPALASFIGTVNDGDGFLADSTGNRRFLVTTLIRIDWGYTALDVNQIWAQAAAYYRQGQPWQLQPHELALQMQTNRTHEIGDPLDGWLERHFLFGISEDTVGMTTADIIDHLRWHDVPVTADRSWETRIGAVLRRRGIGKRQIAGDDGRRARRYFGIAAR